MRLICQKGVHDVPYCNCVVIRDGNYIYASVGEMSECLLAKYSSKEKAEKALKKMREAHAHFEVMHVDGIFQFPQDSEV